MLNRLLKQFLFASKVGTIVAGIGLLIMVVNYIDAVHGKKIKKYLNSP